jgi:hypothetical protein
MHIQQARHKEALVTSLAAALASSSMARQDIEFGRLWSTYLQQTTFRTPHGDIGIILIAKHLD